MAHKRELAMRSTHSRIHIHIFYARARLWLWLKRLPNCQKPEKRNTLQISELEGWSA